MRNVLRGLAALAALGCGDTDCFVGNMGRARMQDGRRPMHPGPLRGLGDLVCVSEDGDGNCNEEIDTSDNTVFQSGETTFTPSGDETENDIWAQATPAEVAAATSVQTGTNQGGGLTTAQAQAAGILTTVLQQSAVQGGRWLAQQVGGQTLYYPQGSGFSSFNLAGMMPLLLIGGVILIFASSSKGGNSGNSAL